MRILYHHRTRAEDGQAVHIRSLIAAFQAEGHELREESLVARAQSASGEPARSSLVSRLANVPPVVRELLEYAYTWPARGRLVRAARAFQPDFIYERYAFGNAAGVQAARKCGVPLVLEVNSPMVLELGKTRGLTFRKLGLRVETSIFKAATLVCVVTEVLREMLIEMGVAPERIHVTPNGVQPELYAEPDSAAARARLGVAPDAGPVLGFVGYYRDWHRLELVIEGLTGDSLRTAVLVLVGAGPAEDDLRARAQQLGVQERVIFAGPHAHDEIPALLAGFDIALLPAINPYASPLKLHEYMCAALPTVAPDQANLREVLQHEHNALLVEPGDGASFMSAVTRLAADTALRAELGREAARTIVTRDLTWRANARRVVNAVKELP